MRLATALTAGEPTLWAAGVHGYHLVPGQGRADAGTLLEAVDVGSALERGLLARIGDLVTELDKNSAGTDLRDLDLLPPVLRPRAILCVGRNYAEHVAEGDVDLPAEPLLFSKFVNTLVADGAHVPYPTITTELDYEGELALVIGRRASRVTQADAWNYVAGYTIINDISARDLQESDMQWIRGKSLDGFAPMGPCVITSDEVPDLDSLRIRTWVNGELRQNAAVADMHFKIPQLLEFITAGITLEPGDVVATGTPAGVGLGFKPPKWLLSGDKVEVSVDSIGTLTCIIA